MIPLIYTSPCCEARVPDQPFFYRIRTDGALDPKWVCWFEDIELKVEGDQTILSGWMPDMAALYGVIDRLRDLGLPLVAVDRASLT